MKLVLELIMAAGLLATLVGVILGFQESILNFKLSKLTLSQLPVRKKAYCQMVIDWCHDNLANTNTKKPIVRLSYYPHKKIGGKYFTNSHECLIYVNDDLKVRELTNTLIHEYIHARQKKRDFDKMYERFQKQVGYEHNPFEIEARSIAKKYERQCLSSVWSQIK